MKAYEIHTFKEGKWRIDSMFDDRELAVHEAERMDRSGRFSGVRVIEEVYDEETQQSRTRTVYRGQRAEQEAADRMAEARRKQQVRKPRKPGGGDIDMSRLKGRKKKKKGGSAVGMLVVLGLLGVLGIGMLIGLRYVQELL